MAEVRQDPLTLRPTWRTLPFPFAPGTTEAAVGHVAIRFVVKLDAGRAPGGEVTRAVEGRLADRRDDLVAAAGAGEAIDEELALAPGVAASCMLERSEVLPRRAARSTPSSCALSRSVVNASTCRSRRSRLAASSPRPDHAYWAMQ